MTSGEMTIESPTTLLAIDDLSLPFRKEVCLHLGQPEVRAEPVLTPGPRDSIGPDNSGAHFYGTVLRDAGRFRMWYYACHWGRNPDWPPELQQQIARLPGWMQGEAALYQGPLCYAESGDGIHWEKPALDQVPFKGSRANNALALPHAVVSGAAVIRDDRDPDPERRYKLVYQYFPDQTDPVIEAYGTQPTIALATSADGLQWQPSGIPFPNQFIEHCCFLQHGGQYIVHYQVMGEGAGARSEGGFACGRTGVARMSADFNTWPDLWTEAFALPEPRDPADRGFDHRGDQVHLGVGAASLGNVCVGLYGVWHNAPFSAAFHDISCDLGLLVSNDGLHFREPVKGHVFISREASPVTPAPGHAYNTVLCQGNGILNVGDETRIYHGRWRNVGNQPEHLVNYHGEIALATLPRDRWGGLSLIPGADAGAICSAPLAVPAGGCRVEVNADGGAGITVDLLDERFQPLAPFSGDAAGVLRTANGLDRAVDWPAGSLASLAGERVRLQVRLQRREDADPRLYAVYLRPGR